MVSKSIISGIILSTARFQVEYLKAYIVGGILRSAQKYTLQRPTRRASLRKQKRKILKVIISKIIKIKPKTGRQYEPEPEINHAFNTWKSTC